MVIAEPGRTQWDLKWTLAGVPIRVHPLFWLMALILSYRVGDPFSFVLLSILVIFCSILVHEFGHALCGRHYGDRDNAIVLYALGGLCTSTEQPARVWPRIWISFWGPGAGFILGVLAAFMLVLIPDPSQYPYLYHMLRTAAWVNLVWGGINLLVPVFPLDCGQIMREIVLWKAPRQGDLLVFTISFYAAIAAGVGALIYALYQPNSDWREYFPAALFLSLAYTSYQVRKQLRAGAVFGGEDARRDPWEQDPDWWKKGH
jgi:stage IV sporulation protein FB